MDNDPHHSPDLADVDALLAQAVRCRRLARQSLDARSIAVLTTLAAECEKKAAAIRAMYADRN